MYPVRLVSVPGRLRWYIGMSFLLAKRVSGCHREIGAPNLLQAVLSVVVGEQVLGFLVLLAPVGYLHDNEICIL